MCQYDVWVGWLLVVNGLYDLVCAGCIWRGCCGEISVMHLDVLSGGGWGGNVLAVHFGFVLGVDIWVCEVGGWVLQV